MPLAITRPLARRQFLFHSQKAREFNRKLFLRSLLAKEALSTIKLPRWPISLPKKKDPLKARTVVPIRKYISLVVTLILSSGLSLKYLSLIDVVPITNRERLMWGGILEEEEEVGYTEIKWMLGQLSKPRIAKESHTSKVVREVLDRLLEANQLNALKLELHIFDNFENPNAFATPTKHGGTIAINTGCLSRCKSLDQVAGVLAHEIGHLVARHVVEKRTSRWIAGFIAHAFGFRSELPRDLVTSRMHEVEADYMGLIYMANAGFDPQKTVDALTEKYREELEALEGNKPSPEFLNTHPNCATRVAKIESALPEAKIMFKKRQYLRPTPAMIEKWDQCKVFVEERKRVYLEKQALKQRIKPENLLKEVHTRLERVDKLEVAFSRLVEKWMEEIADNATKVEAARESAARTTNGEAAAPPEEPVQSQAPSAELATTTSTKVVPLGNVSKVDNADTE